MRKLRFRDFELDEAHSSNKWMSWGLDQSGLITKFVIFLPEQIVFDGTLKRDLLNWQKFFKVC